jgi:hypothetical protein
VLGVVATPMTPVVGPPPSAGPGGWPAPR